MTDLQRLAVMAGLEAHLQRYVNILNMVDNGKLVLLRVREVKLRSYTPKRD